MLFRRTEILNVQQVIEADNLNIYSLIQQTSLFMHIKRHKRESIIYYDEFSRWCSHRVNL